MSVDMVEAVCFDLDGTLFDDRQYQEAGLRAAARTIKDRTGVDLTQDLFEAFFDQNIREQTFDFILKRHGLPTDLVPELIDSYHAHEEALEPYPETVDVLDDLQGQYRLGLLTGGTNGHDKIERLGIETYFNAIVVAPARGLTKRDPEAFVRLLADIDVAASEAVFVGDRPELDFPHANDLGMHTVRVNTGFYADAVPESKREEPDSTIECLSELSEVLDTLT